MSTVANPLPPHADWWHHGRLVTVVAVVMVWSVGLVLRLYWLQVERYEHYVAKAEEQQQRVVVLDAPRGTIYDARGRQLAVSVEADSIAANPRLIGDKAATAQALAKILGKRAAELQSALDSDRRFVWIERKVDRAVGDQVRALDLDGIQLLPESKRYYPLGEVAAQVLGYVGTDNNGLAGLEYLYEKDIANEQGQRTVMLDGLRGRVLAPNLDRADARAGKDLHLTLDAALQHLVERELAAAMKSSSAKHGTVVMMDTLTGAVLAMATAPTFDPNRFADFPAHTWSNRPITDAYEPGSTFKMVTLAAALEANNVDLLDTYDCGHGSIVLGRTRIRDHTPFGDLTVREIMARSSNVGAIKLGQAAGRDRLHSTIEAFGFGKPTGIDLPSESPGLLHPFERWSPLTPAYVSFGQGLSITALQLTNSFVAIANGGRLLKPYVVASVGAAPEPGDNHRQVVGLPISPSSVRQVSSMLESVVQDGTAKSARMPGYGAAGKTGTAQMAVDGRYASDRFVASFVGFAPVEKPRLAVAVVIHEPWPRYHGGEVAAPVFKNVVHQALLYLGVPPDIDMPERHWPTPDLLDRSGLGRGGLTDRPTVAKLRTASSSGVPKPDREPDPRVAQAEGTVPDFVGLSAREAVLLSSDLGLELQLDGHGAVERQQPEPGTPLEMAGDALSLWLSPRAMASLPARMTVSPSPQRVGADARGGAE